VVVAIAAVSLLIAALFVVAPVLKAAVFDIPTPNEGSLQGALK
jgi:hypothetical protein